MAASITSVDRLFTQVAGAPEGRVAERYFLEELPQKVLDKAADMPLVQKYEAIVVDEGQDFGELRVIALLDLLANGGQWLFFADWRQDVYRAGNGDVLGAEVTFRLYHNCRNTERTNTATNRYCRQSISSMPGVPIGVVPLVSRCTSPRAMAMRAWDLAHEFSPEGGAVFISPYRLGNSCVDAVRRGHGLELTEDIRNLGRSGFVFFSTIKSFKGLEAQQVILLHADMPDRSQAFASEDLYVACTRATGRLAILVSTEEASNWFTQNLT
jgi:superfamily I DNA/RNA helicase